jgi:hypothetical protein
MTQASLQRFTVPLSGDQSANAQGLLMPKLQFRFRGIFDNFGAGSSTLELTKQIVTFQRPQVTFEPIEVPVYNSKVYLAGRPTWTAVPVTIRDDAGGNVTKVVGEQLQKQFDFMEQASASSGIDYKFNATIEMLDGANGTVQPTVLETWALYGCFLTDVNYNELNYGNNDAVTITLSIRYDNAVQTTGGSTAKAITPFKTSAITG